jgi:hypothetical protein
MKKLGKKELSKLILEVLIKEQEEKNEINQFINDPKSGRFGDMFKKFRDNKETLGPEKAALDILFSDLENKENLKISNSQENEMFEIIVDRYKNGKEDVKKIIREKTVTLREKRKANPPKGGAVEELAGLLNQKNN